MTEAQCLDFDFAVLDFWDWFEHKADEQVIVKDRGKQPKKGQTWGKKYPSVDDILRQYYATHDVSHAISAEFEDFIKDELQGVLDDAFGDEDLM